MIKILTKEEVFTVDSWQLFESHEELRRQNKELCAAVKEFGQHDIRCHRHQLDENWEPAECDCGFDAARKALGL